MRELGVQIENPGSKGRPFIMRLSRAGHRTGAEPIVQTKMLGFPNCGGSK